MTKIRVNKIRRNKERRDSIRLFITSLIIAESMLIYGIMTATTLS